MGLKILTVLKINEDTSKAGSILFNSNRVTGMQLNGTTDTFFLYPSDLKTGGKTAAVVKDKVVVDETLTTADGIYDAVNKTFQTLPVYDDVNDITSSTTNIVIDPNDIAKGKALTATPSKSLLWIQEGGIVRKYLVNKYLGAIEDYIMTGTTTSSTSTSTSSSTSTSTSSSTTSSTTSSTSTSTTSSTSTTTS
jgi:hypothetical protein